MFLYRLLISLAAPAFVVRLLRDDADDRAERLGRARPGKPAGHVVWLHAASNGELTSARPVIEGLLNRRPDLQVLITCNTVTGRTLARGWHLDRCAVHLAPLDYRTCLRRVLDNWAPAALIVIENELWPNRMLAMAGRGCPVIVLSARMSRGSARMWGRFPGLARKVIGTISYLSAQDADSSQRFVRLGLPADRIGPVCNFKTGAAQDTHPDTKELDRLRPDLPRDHTLLAASTHAGEEEIVLEGFREALAAKPDLRLILAPRHPRRRPEIETIARRLGLGVAVRSRGETIGPGHPVYLADTMGEMPLWYALAGVTFVGGSLVDKGGHTPFEPAAHGSALLHGPHLDNFAEIYAQLQACGGSRQVLDAGGLRDALLSLDAKTRSHMVTAATRAIEGIQDSAAVDKILDDVLGVIGPGRRRP